MLVLRFFSGRRGFSGQFVVYVLYCGVSNWTIIFRVQAGEVCALFGLDCSSGDTFTSGDRISMTSIKVPDPVVSLAITPKSTDTQNFFKALARFQREDPTFRVHTDHESGEVIMSGMGELHLEVYAERVRREYGIDCKIGNPKVCLYVLQPET